jgi:hypothetical protein
VIPGQTEPLIPVKLSHLRVWFDGLKKSKK